MSDEQQQGFTRELQKTLRDSEESIDELTLAKIRAARAKASDVVPQRKPIRWMLPISVAATLFLVIGSVLLIPNMGNDALNVDVVILEDLDILDSNESLELAEELEFYEWLDSQVDNSSV